MRTVHDTVADTCHRSCEQQCLSDGNAAGHLVVECESEKGAKADWARWVVVEGLARKQELEMDREATETSLDALRLATGVAC